MCMVLIVNHACSPVPSLLQSAKLLVPCILPFDAEISKFHQYLDWIPMRHLSHSVSLAEADIHFILPQHPKLMLLTE